MKCSIAKDILTLYAEGLCSEETAAELEKHLEECEECKKQLEHYRTEITQSAEEKTDSEQLKPMKKVSKKLKIKTAAVTALVMILAAVAGCISVLSYGELTNYGVSFSLIADYIKLKNVSEKLADGDTQPLIDVICFNSDNYYSTQNISDFKTPREYKDVLKKQMDETYEKLLAGRDIKVKASGLLLNWYEDDDKRWIYEDPYSSYLTFDFCEGDNVIITLDFAKVRNGKFVVYDYSEIESGSTFTGNILPGDDIIFDICLRNSIKNAADSKSEKTSNGWKIIVDGIYGEDNTDYAEKLGERVSEMYAGSCIPVDAMYAVDSFDDSVGLWVYKVWVEYENKENGTSCIAEYKFYYHNNNLFVKPDFEPRILSADGEVSAEDEEMILNMFS